MKTFYTVLLVSFVVLSFFAGYHFLDGGWKSFLSVFTFFNIWLLTIYVSRARTKLVMNEKGEDTSWL